MQISWKVFRRLAGWPLGTLGTGGGEQLIGESSVLEVAATRLLSLNLVDKFSYWGFNSLTLFLTDQFDQYVWLGLEQLSDGGPRLLSPGCRPLLPLRLLLLLLLLHPLACPLLLLLAIDPALPWGGAQLLHYWNNFANF